MGVTKDSFKERFRRHSETGVIHKAWSGTLPKGAEGMGLYAYITHYTGDAANQLVYK